MIQEVIIVFDQMVKQSLSFIPCQLMRYVLLKIFDCLKIGHYAAAVNGTQV